MSGQIRSNRIQFSKGLGLGLFACMFVLLVNNFFGDRWSYFEISAYLWIIAGLASRLNIISQNPQPQPVLTQEITKTTPAALPAQKAKKKVRYYDL